MATESDNVNSGALGTLVAVGTFAMLGICLVVTALVRAEVADEAQKKDVAADRPYRDLVAEQQAQLNAPAAFKDRGSGMVSLPIDRAMELVVSGLAKDPNSATPPAPVGGSGGSAGAAAEAGGSAGMGGMGGAAGSGGAAATTEGQPAPESPEPKPAEDPKKEPEKKEAPKPAPGAPGAPAAPAPVAPTPVAPTPITDTPSPAPNGQ